MTSELIPYGCDLPMRHYVDAFDHQEIHYWHVVGLAGTISLRAVRVAELPFLLNVTPRDGQGAYWLGSRIEFHGVAPMFGNVFFDDCLLTGGRCWLDDQGTLGAMALIERLLPLANRDMHIHRALIAEYHMNVAEAWLRSMSDPGPFDDREINDVASELL